MVERIISKMAALSDKILLSSQPVVNEMDSSPIFTLEFVPPIPREYLCTLCEEPMKKPCHLTCCNGSYCGKCAKRLKDSSLACKRCCSLSYHVDIDSHDEATEQLILDLQVYCPLRSPGCMWRGKLGDLDGHLQWGEYDQNDVLSCRYLPVPCSKKCSKLIPRRDMDVHANVDCTLRMKQCVCGKTDLAENIDDEHAANECVMRAVDCPNKCKMPGLRYKNLQQHMESQCPLRMVNCEYENIGCDGWFQHKDLQAHNDTHIQEHFWLMCQKLVMINNANEELRSSILYSMSVCSKLEKNCSELLIQLDEKKRHLNSPETVASTEVEAGESSGNVESGYASMGRQDTLKRYQQVSYPGYYSRQISNTSPSNKLKNLASSNQPCESDGNRFPPPPPLPPRTHKVGSNQVGGPGRGKTASRAVKPVSTGSIAFSRLTQSTSNLPSIIADSEPQLSTSPSFRQVGGLLQQDRSVSPFNGHYAHASEWGVPSATSTLSPIPPESNPRGHTSIHLPGTRRTDSSKRRMLARHRKISTTLSVEEGYEKLGSRVKLDVRVRSESVATFPSSIASRQVSLPSSGMSAIHSASESCISASARHVAGVDNLKSSKKQGE